MPSRGDAVDAQNDPKRIQLLDIWTDRFLKRGFAERSRVRQSGNAKPGGKCSGLLHGHGLGLIGSLTERPRLSQTSV